MTFVVLKMSSATKVERLWWIAGAPAKMPRLISWLGGPAKAQIEKGCRNTADEETNELRGDQSGNLASGTCALQREDKRHAGVRVVHPTKCETGGYSRGRTETIPCGDHDPAAAQTVYLIEKYVVHTPSRKNANVPKDLPRVRPFI